MIGDINYWWNTYQILQPKASGNISKLHCKMLASVMAQCMLKLKEMSPDPPFIWVLGWWVYILDTESQILTSSWPWPSVINTRYTRHDFLLGIWFQNIVHESNSPRLSLNRFDPIAPAFHSQHLSFLCALEYHSRGPSDSDSGLVSKGMGNQQSKMARYIDNTSIELNKRDNVPNCYQQSIPLKTLLIPLS